MENKDYEILEIDKGERISKALRRAAIVCNSVSLALGLAICGAKTLQKKNDSKTMKSDYVNGYVIEDATIQGSVGTIPAGSVFPVKITKYISTQTSTAGDVYVGVAPQNYTTKDHYILVYEGSNFKGQLLDVRSGKWFVRNGVLVLENSLITTYNDQVTNFKATGELSKDRNWFMRFVRATLKGEKLEAAPTDVVYMRLLEPVKIDLTNGWIYEE